MVLKQLFLHIVPMVLGLLSPPGIANILPVNVTTASTATNNGLNVLGQIDLRLQVISGSTPGNDFLALLQSLYRSQIWIR